MRFDTQRREEWSGPHSVPALLMGSTTLLNALDTYISSSSFFFYILASGGDGFCCDVRSLSSCV